jgi:DNA polymerase III subunit beta
MKIKIKKENLEKLLSKVYPILPGKSAMPALTNVLLEAKEKELSISATDLETAITSIDKTEVKAEGSIALNGKDFYGMVRELPNKDIEISVDNLSAKITCEKIKFNIQGMDKSDFPNLLSVKKQRKVTLPFEVLQKGVEKTLFAASTGEISSIISGALFDLQQEEFRIIATDGHRMAIYKNKIKLGNIMRFVISPKVWKEVANFSSGVDIYFNENTVGLFSEDTVIVSRIMEGEFPPYEAVIPKHNDKTLTVSKEELNSAVKRALVVAPDISHLLKFKLSNESVTIEANSERGEVKEEIPCKYKGDSMEIGYNGNYILSVINKIGTESVKFLLKDPEAAALIVPDIPKKDEKEEELVYLLMPIKLI